MSRLSGDVIIVRDAATKLVSDDTAIQSLTTGIAGSAAGLIDLADGLVADATAMAALRLGYSGPIGITKGAGMAGVDNYETFQRKETTGIIKTEILIEIDGTDSSGDEALDILGDGTGASAHIGGWDSAWGTVFAGTMECLQAPTTGEPDIDLGYATESTLAASALMSTGTNVIVGLASAGDWTVSRRLAITLFPDTTSPYLYLAQGITSGTDAGEYAAGIFMITFYGK